MNAVDAALRAGDFTPVDLTVQPGDATLSISGFAPDEALLEFDGRPVARVTAPVGSPANPLGAAALGAKVRALCGDALEGALDDLQRPASGMLDAIFAR
jgi:hypothetical protein